MANSTVSSNSSDDQLDPRLADIFRQLSRVQLPMAPDEPGEEQQKPVEKSPPAQKPVEKSPPAEKPRD